MSIIKPLSWHLGSREKRSAAEQQDPMLVSASLSLHYKALHLSAVWLCQLLSKQGITLKAYFSAKTQKRIF